MSNANIDDSAELWLRDHLDPRLPLENELREALSALGGRDIPLLPPFALPPFRVLPEIVSVLADRHVDEFAARAYDVRVPGQSHQYTLVLVNIGARIVHIGWNRSPPASASPPEVQALLRWQIGVSVLAKLLWYDLQPAYGLSSVATVAIDRCRWMRRDRGEQDALITQVRRLVRAYRLVTFLRREPIALRLRAYDVDSNGQEIPGTQEVLESGQA